MKPQHSQPLAEVATLIPGKLAFMFDDPGKFANGMLSATTHSKISWSASVASNSHTQHFSFPSDFEAVNLGVIYRFCRFLSNKMRQSPALTIYCSDATVEAATNAALLLGSFLMLQMGLTSTDAAKRLRTIELPQASQREQVPNSDAGSFVAPVPLLDLLRGIEIAVRLNWFSLDSFDLERYETFEAAASGRVHEICLKLVAFGVASTLSSHPPTNAKAASAAASGDAVEHCAPHLAALNTTCVVWVVPSDNGDHTDDCDSLYRAGMRIVNCVVDLRDAATAVDHFLAICDATAGRIAVYCGAAPAAAGALLAAWAIRRAGMPAAAAVAWIRAVRPGAISPSQLRLLRSLESRHPGSASRDSADALRPTPGPAASAHVLEARRPAPLPPPPPLRPSIIQAHAQGAAPRRCGPPTEQSQAAARHGGAEAGARQGRETGLGVASTGEPRRPAPVPKLPLGPLPLAPLPAPTAAGTLAYCPAAAPPRGASSCPSSLAPIHAPGRRPHLRAQEAANNVAADGSAGAGCNGGLRRSHSAEVLRAARAHLRSGAAESAIFARRAADSDSDDSDGCPAFSTAGVGVPVDEFKGRAAPPPAPQAEAAAGVGGPKRLRPQDRRVSDDAGTMRGGQGGRGAWPRPLRAGAAGS